MAESETHEAEAEDMRLVERNLRTLLDRQQAQVRANLDLQISLLSEHEITRLIAPVHAVADRLQIEPARDPELSQLEKNVRPERVLDEIEEHSARQDASE